MFYLWWKTLYKMIHHSTNDLENMERFYRANLINSVTGYKSANLLATKSKSGISNVSIFSSVTHLGSNPAMFTFIQRPLGHGVGHTYKNLKETGTITLNHINQDLLDQAHQSSAKYPATTSEFEILDIDEITRDGIYAPFVGNAAVQVAATYENEYFLKENNCILVLCRITDIYINDEVQLKDGWLNLESAGSLAINGLDGYATGTMQKRLSYAKVDKELKDVEF